MEKEELKKLKDWCIEMETLINLVSTHNIKREYRRAWNLSLNNRQIKQFTFIRE